MVPLLSGIAFCFAVDLPPAEAKSALQPFGRLVGSWKATGYPDGPRDDPMNRFWSERVTVEWRFRGDDAWLTLAFGNGKHFSAGELRYDPKQAEFRLVLTTTDKQTLTFTSRWAPSKPEQVPILSLDRTDRATGESQRIGLRLLHSNRLLYSFEVKPANRRTFTRKYQVGATKEGEPFAEVATGPKCVVSGGEAKIAVTYNGKTYHVCCSGCRDAFKDDPEKYIRRPETRPQN